MQFKDGHKPAWDSWTVKKRWKFLWRIERILRKKNK